MARGSTTWLAMQASKLQWFASLQAISLTKCYTATSIVICGCCPNQQQAQVTLFPSGSSLDPQGTTWNGNSFDSGLDVNVTFISLDEVMRAVPKLYEDIVGLRVAFSVLTLPRTRPGYFQPSHNLTVCTPEP